MLYSDIYSQALTYTGETASSTAVSDFSDRADYLLPGVVTRFAAASTKLGTAPTLPTTDKVAKTDTFPLDNKLASCAAALLAAYLVVAEEPDLSLRLISIADAMLEGVVPKEIA